jgi:hypothetical protein
MYPADTHPCGVLQHLVGDLINQDILIALVELEGFAAHDIFPSARHRAMNSTTERKLCKLLFAACALRGILSR